MESEPTEPHADSLAHVEAVATTYADAPRGEGWYHLALGFGAGVFVMAQGLTQPWALIVSFAFILLVPLFITWWRRTHGWWVSGYTGGATMWVSGLTLVALAGTAIWSYLSPDFWTSLVAGAAAFIAVSTLGFVWMRVWRHQLQAQGAA